MLQAKTEQIRYISITQCFHLHGGQQILGVTRSDLDSATASLESWESQKSYAPQYPALRALPKVAQTDLGWNTWITEP